MAQWTGVESRAGTIPGEKHRGSKVGRDGARAQPGSAAFLF